MQSPRAGLLIAFDGIDSSGKATQAHLLAERFRYLGKDVHEFTTPDYNTPSGQELKLWLQGKKGNWHALAWQEKAKMFAVNRAEKRERVVSALGRGEIVIYDRYIPSSLAFMTIEGTTPQNADFHRPEIHRAVEQLEYEENSMPREVVSIFLDVPVHVSIALLEKRKQYRKDADEYTDHVHVMERLYNEYDVMCTDDPKRYLRLKITTGTELLAIDDVAELVWEGLKERFGSAIIGK